MKRLDVVTFSSVEKNEAFANPEMPIFSLKDTAIKWLEENMTGTQYIDFIRMFVQNYTLSQPAQVNSTGSPSAQIASKGLADLTSKNCNDINFPKVDWSSCDYTGKNLSHAELAGATLAGTDFANANLGGTILTGADLRCQNNPVCVVGGQ